MRMQKKDILFVDYYDEWVRTYKVGAIRDVTLKKYFMTGKRLREICPSLLLDELGRREYQNILNEYAKDHEKQTTQDFHHQVKASIKDAFYDGLIEKDPTYNAIVKGKTPKEKKRKYLNEDEFKKLIKALELGTEINMDWFILILAKTGLRFAEALALTPNDFDFENNTLNVDKTLDYKSGKNEFAPTKNTSSVRKIVIDWQLVGQFRPLIKDLPPDKPIFVPDGKRIFNSTYNSFLERKCKEADITVITLHGLRHTHASILLGEGITLHTISERLGHSNVTTTQEIYTHVIKELEQKDNSRIIGVLTALV